jgi:hypothetical protein
MTHTIGNIIFGAIRNVRKSGDEEGVYFADVELSEAEGFPMLACFYVARADDYATTGRWVYQQIVNGNIEGGITQLAPNVDPITGKVYPEAVQPISNGSQTL